MMRLASATGFGLAALLAAAAFLSPLLPWAAAARAALVLICFLLVLFWILSLRRGWDWFFTPGMLLLFGLLAAGLFLDLTPALLYPAAFLALAGWDLADFAARLRLAGPGDDLAGLQKRHLRRLGLTLGAGAGLLLLALALDLRISLGWMAALAIVAVWGLGQLARGLLKKE